MCGRGRAVAGWPWPYGRGRGRWPGNLHVVGVAAGRMAVAVAAGRLWPDGRWVGWPAGDGRGRGRMAGWPGGCLRGRMAGPCPNCAEPGLNQG